MVVIMKNGKEKVFITRCAECASDLAYRLSDVQKRKDEDKDEFYTQYSYPYIICPVCNANTYVTLTTKEDNEKMKFPTFMSTGGYCCTN